MKNTLSLNLLPTFSAIMIKRIGRKGKIGMGSKENMMEVMKSRHSVRSYTDKKIDQKTKESLLEVIKECNKEGNLHIQLCTDEPKAFNGLMAHYGKFRNVKNYIAIVGKKADDLQERCGYYGEKVVLKAAELGLNTCWVGLTYSKGSTRCKVEKGEKLCCVIALGYGETQGTDHKSKPMENLCSVNGEMPGWFKRGMEAALLAPTAVNQQKFLLTLEGNKIKAEALKGFFSQMDLGIVKCHFEMGAGKNDWQWMK